MLDLYLIRHAQAYTNQQNEHIGGRSDYSPLTPQGYIEATALGNWFLKSNIIFDEIHSSTSVRTLMTATQISTITKFNIESIIKSPSLLELDQGEWEGKLRSEVYTTEVLKEINKGTGDFTPPQGESQNCVAARMMNYITTNILKETGTTTTTNGPCTKAAIFTHGMAIKCFLQAVLKSDPGMTYKIVIDNTSITRVKYTSHGWHIMNINGTTHLQGINRTADLYAGP